MTQNYAVKHQGDCPCSPGNPGEDVVGEVHFDLDKFSQNYESHLFLFRVFNSDFGEGGGTVPPPMAGTQGGGVSPEGGGMACDADATI